MIHRMRAFDLPDVVAIRRACHPDWPAFPDGWYTAYPTLVLEEARRIVGWTAFSVAPAPACEHFATDGEQMYGRGLYVLPDARGRGYGRRLHQARLDAAKAVSAITFIGMTQAWNKPMLRVFESFGYRQYASAPNAYPDGSEGLVYMGEIR